MISDEESTAPVEESETTTAAETETETTSAETETPVIETDPPAPETERKTTYVLNTNTMKFHVPTCSSVKKIKETNYGTFTGTRDEVLEIGFDPCGNCHP
jgi:DNA-entry nuclease